MPRLLKNNETDGLTLLLSALGKSKDQPRWTRQQELQLHTWDAEAARKALSTTSVTLWLVKTLPPTTAAPGPGHSRECGGMRMSMGFRQP